MEPLIWCICPTTDKYRDFLPRAIESFRAQPYGYKRLLVWDTSEGNTPYIGQSPLISHRLPAEIAHTVGGLRNDAIESIIHEADYIAHFDVDDVSSPDRLSVQLAHIQKTGKLLTGFYNMPLHDAKNEKTWIYANEDHRYALGTSLFYRREAWERVKFPDQTPEDNKWRKDVGLDNCESQSCFRSDGSPIMVQTVHGGNASARIYPSSARYSPATAEQSRIVREMLK